MVRSLQAPARIVDRLAVLKRPIVWVSTGYVIAVLWFAVSYLRADSRQAMIALTVTALAPLGLYVALRYPLVFPFCAYVLVLPFDSLSSLGSGGTLSKLLGGVAAVAVLIRVARRGCSLVPSGAVSSWVALLIWMGLTMFWALDVSDAFRSFQMYASLVMLYALLSFMRVTSREFNCVLGAVLVAGIISAGYTAYLYHSGQSLISANAGVSRVMITVGDASIDPNALATALILPTSLALYWLFNSRHILLPVLMIPVLAILLLGFAASGSRGGFIQLGTVFAYLIVRSRNRISLACLTIVATITTLMANPGIPARFADAQQDGGAGRSDIWHVGLYALRDNWALGAGVGNFPNAYDREYINVFSRYVLGWHWVAHNVPLTIATELGVVGVGLFLLAAIRQFRVLRSLAVGEVKQFELRLALEGAYLGVMVAGFSGSNLNAKYVWLAFSLMALYRGLLISQRQR